MKILQTVIPVLASDAPGAHIAPEPNLDLSAIRLFDQLFKDVENKNGDQAFLRRFDGPFKNYLRVVLGVDPYDASSLDADWLNALNKLPAKGDAEGPHSSRLLLAQLLYIAHLGSRAFDCGHQFDQPGFCAFLHTALGQVDASQLDLPQLTLGKSVTTQAARAYLRRVPMIENGQIHPAGLSATIRLGDFSAEVLIPLGARLTDLPAELLDHIASDLPGATRLEFFRGSRRLNMIGDQHWRRLGGFESSDQRKSFFRSCPVTANANTRAFIKDLTRYVERGWIKQGNCAVIKEAYLALQHAKDDSPEYERLQTELLEQVLSREDLARLQAITPPEQQAYVKQIYTSDYAILALVAGFKSDLNLAKDFREEDFESCFFEHWESMVDQEGVSHDDLMKRIAVLSDMPFIYLVHRGGKATVAAELEADSDLEEDYGVGAEFWSGDLESLVAAFEDDDDGSVDVGGARFFLQACDRLAPMIEARERVAAHMLMAACYIVKKEGGTLSQHLDLDFVRTAMCPRKTVEVCDWPISRLLCEDRTQELVTILRSPELNLGKDIPLLHIACSAGKVSNLKRLLEPSDGTEPVDPMEISAFGMSALHHLFNSYETIMTLHDGVLKCLRYLLERVVVREPDEQKRKVWLDTVPGANPFVDPSDDDVALPVLHTVAQRGWLDGYALLVAAGADRNCRGSDGSTVLHRASGEMLLHLLNQLQDISMDIDVRDDAGKTPLYRAIHRHDEYGARLLLERGASLSAKTARGYTCLYVLARHFPHLLMELKGTQNVVEAIGVNVAFTPDLGEAPPIFRACMRADEKAIEALLACGARIDTADIDGHTLLHIYVRSADQESDDSYDQKQRRYGFLKRFLDQPEGNIHAFDRKGYQPFHHAVQEGKLKMMTLFLASRLVDVQARVESTGDTNLHLAIESNNPAVLQALLCHDKIEQLFKVSNQDGETALDMARHVGNVGMISLLEAAYQKAGVSLAERSACEIEGH